MAHAHRVCTPPEIILRSYGRGGLDIVCQTQSVMCPYQHTAVVLVQNETSEDLLFDTDVQPQLGFQLLQKTQL